MDGILVADKPQGMTSHDVVDFVRKSFSVKKVGHAGTLDPMATGVLVLLLGTYTKLSGGFIVDDKEYEAELVLGASSDTGDAWGRVRDSGRPSSFTDHQIEEVFNRFKGETEQTPPMYSAVKVNGRKLYELARKGIKADVAPRKIVIKELSITSKKLPRISFRLTCSKGTYVRQICVDIGDYLGCGAYLSSLKRTRSGRFTIEGSVGFDELRAIDRPGLEKRLRRI